MSFNPFDPLEFKNTKVTDAALGALRREIENILSSYVGWYDPFAELIQNALDAVEARSAVEKASTGNSSYEPKICITIDLVSNALTVTDNGIGLDKDKFEQFLAPNFSFKSGETRGHKGVGATYVAYGFNFMRIATKSPGFSAIGRIVNARSWLRGNATGANPKVEPDDGKKLDHLFTNSDRGVSITVRFDESTHPRKLDWIQASTAENWWKILTVKTGLGSIVPDAKIEVEVRVRSKDGETTYNHKGTGYLWLHSLAPKKARLRDIIAASDAAYKKSGVGAKLPDKFNSLDFIYEAWTADELVSILKGALDPEELDILACYKPTVSLEFGYTTRLWTKFNESLGVRSGYVVLSPGIQLAANNMPQGETIQIPLKRYIGRQNQLHFLFHFQDYTPDLGRKGFNRELCDFAKTAARYLTDTHLAKQHGLLKANTGAAPDLAREIKISDWKKEMIRHEEEDPLLLTNKHFFAPTERISVTSEPTREQDVIALFHQLIAGGVVRGIRAMSTNERLTYDGLFRIAFDLTPDLYVYEEEINPLGVSVDTVQALKGRVTEPRVLEYKFCLDGLIEDLESQDKNLKDIDLCVVWTTGKLYKERYGIRSLLLPENADQRQCHGVTHILADLETDAKHCDLIVLSELIERLNDSAKSEDAQRQKYE